MIKLDIAHKQFIDHLRGLDRSPSTVVAYSKDIEQWKAAIVKDDIGNWYNILANKEIEDNYDNVNNPIPSGMLIGQDGKIVWKSGADETLEVALKRLINKS